MTRNLKLRDRVLEGILETYAANPVLSEELVLQGGGAMHFMYGTPRYSLDLDFVCPQLSRKREEILAELSKGVSVDGQLVPAQFKDTGRGSFVRIGYPLGLSMPSGKAEILEQISFENARTTGKYAPLRVESPAEIYADKIVATMERLYRRGSIKGTDLFDLNYIADVLRTTCPRETIMKKAHSYNNPDLIDNVSLLQTIVHIRNEEHQEAFRKDLEKTLLPDVFASMRFDASYFKRAQEHFDQYMT